MATSPFGITFPSSSAISPSVRVVERDQSIYQLGNPGTAVAIAGFASKGPINVPTSIGTRDQLRRIFGSPRLDSDAIPYALYAAEQYLRVGGNLLFLRVGVTDPADQDFARTAFVTLPSAGAPARSRSYFGSAGNPVPDATDFNQIPIDLGKSKSLRIRVNGDSQPWQLTVEWPSDLGDVRYYTGNISGNGSRISEDLVRTPTTPDRGITDGSFIRGNNVQHLIFRPEASGGYSLVNIFNEMLRLLSAGTTAPVSFSVINASTSVNSPDISSDTYDQDLLNFNESFDNGKLVVTSTRVNGPDSSIEFVSVDGDIGNDLGLGIGRTNEVVEGLDDRYPSTSSEQKFDLTAVAGRTLDLVVIANGSGNGDIDGVEQRIEMTKLGTNPNDGTGPIEVFSEAFGAAKWTASQVAHWINIGGDLRTPPKGFQAVVGTNATGFSAEIAESRIVDNPDRGFANDGNGIVYLDQVVGFNNLPASGTIYVRNRAFNYEGKVATDNAASVPGFVATTSGTQAAKKSFNVDIRFVNPTNIAVGSDDVRFNVDDIVDMLNILPGKVAQVEALAVSDEIYANNEHDGLPIRLDISPYDLSGDIDTAANGSFYRAVNSLASIHKAGFKIIGARNVTDSETYADSDIGTVWINGSKARYLRYDNSNNTAAHTITTTIGAGAGGVGLEGGPTTVQQPIRVVGPGTIRLSGIQTDNGRLSQDVADTVQAGLPNAIAGNEPVGPAGNNIYTYQVADNPLALNGPRIYGVRRAGGYESTDRVDLPQSWYDNAGVVNPVRNLYNPGDISFRKGDAVVAQNGYRDGAVVLEGYYFGSDAVLYVRGDSTADTFFALPNYATIASESPVGTVCLTRDNCDDFFYGIIKGSSKGGNPDGSFRITAESAGIDGNDTRVDLAINKEDATVNIFVWHKGANVETFQNLSKATTITDTEGNTVPNPFYLETYVSAISNYIRIVDNTRTTELPKPGRFRLGDQVAGSPVDASSGSDGVPLAIDGSIDENQWADVVLGTEVRNNGLWAMVDVERFPIDIVMVPGGSSTDIVDGLIYFCEVLRRDCMAFVDPPFGLTADETRLWHNGKHPLNTVELNSSFAAMFWPWVLYRDTTNRTNVWCPPSMFLASMHTVNDFNRGPWIAVAGTTRGVLPNAQALEYNPSLGVRDTLYGNQNAVNCIIDTPVDGIHVMGQKTLQRRPSALDRVNVRRMMLYIEKTIRQRSKRLLFEPLTPTLYTRFSQIADDVLLGVQNNDGIRDYRIKVDSEINTADTIDRNELRAKIAVQPVKAAEFIFIEFSVHRTGSFEESGS